MRKDEFSIIKEYTKEKIKKELIRVKDDIGIYYSDCFLSIADNDEKCKKCNDITFNSVLNIIDKHIKEIEQERTMAAEPIKAELNQKGQ